MRIHQYMWRPQGAKWHTPSNRQITYPALSHRKSPGYHQETSSSRSLVHGTSGSLVYGTSRSLAYEIPQLTILGDSLSVISSRLVWDVASSVQEILKPALASESSVSLEFAMGTPQMSSKSIECRDIAVFSLLQKWPCKWCSVTASFSSASCVACCSFGLTSTASAVHQLLQKSNVFLEVVFRCSRCFIESL